jgi:tyrosine-protein kinase Etk/Wzc
MPLKQIPLQEDYKVPEKQTNLFAEIGQRYLPYWPLFVITLTLSLAVSFFYLRYTSPVYKASGKILLKDEKKGVDASKLLDALNIFGEKKIVENEIDILKSWPLMESVVKKLRLYATVYREGSIRDVELFGKTAPVYFEAVQPDSIQPLKYKVQFRLDLDAQTLVHEGKAYANGSIIYLDKNKFKIVFNKQFVREQDVNPKYHLVVSSTSSIAQGLLKTLNIAATSKQSSVVEIGLESQVPEKAEAIINNLFSVYQQASLEDKNLVAANTLSFVEERLKLVVQELANVESDIEQYKTQEGIVDIGAQSKLFLETVKENDERISQLNIQLSVLQDIETYVTGKGPNPGTVPSLMGLSDPTLVQLLTRLYDAETQYAKLQKVTGEKSDVQEQLRDELSRLRPAIQENIRNIRTNLVATKSNLLGQLAQTSQLLKQANCSRKYPIRSEPWWKSAGNKPSKTAYTPFYYRRGKKLHFLIPQQ